MRLNLVWLFFDSWRGDITYTTVPKKETFYQFNPPADEPDTNTAGKGFMRLRRIDSPPLGVIRDIPIDTSMLCGGVVYFNRLFNHILPTEDLGRQSYSNLRKVISATFQSISMGSCNNTKFEI